MFVCCECRVLSGRGLCDELIARPEESYRLWCVVLDLETSRIGAPYIYIYICDISSLSVKILPNSAKHTHTHTHINKDLLIYAASSPLT